MASSTKVDASNQWSKEEEVFQCVVDSDLSSLTRVLAADVSVISSRSAVDVRLATYRPSIC